MIYLGVTSPSPYRKVGYQFLGPGINGGRERRTEVLENGSAVLALAMRYLPGGIGKEFN